MSAQVKGRIEHFASRGAMDIEGLGEALINLFVDLGYLKTYDQIYDLKNKRKRTGRNRTAWRKKH